MNPDLHRLLTRQLRKLKLDAQCPPDAENWSILLSAISITYHDADQDRYTLERSLALSSEEMHALYQRQKYSYETRLRALFSTIQDLVRLKDPEGTYLACNPMFERCFGAKEAGIVGKTDYDFVDKELADSFREHDRIAITKGGPSVNEEQVTFADDGHSALLETIKTPMYDESGQLIGVIGTARDITERKKNEHALQRESEKNLALLRNASDGIHILDCNGNIIEASDSFCNMLGYRRDEIIGMNARQWDANFSEVELEKVIKQQFAHPVRSQFETRHRRKDGTIFDVEVSGFPLKLDEKPALFNSSRDITANKAAADQIKSLAFYDPLTNLPNRRLLMDRLKQALVSRARSGREGALLFIDLDNFKALNDTMGHDIGDLLLQQVAERLTTCIRVGDTVARLGGDEFVVMLEDLSEQALEAAAQTEAAGEKVLLVLNQPYLLATHQYHSTPSIGASLFSDCQQSIEELMKQADIAMYQAKKTGRNTLRFFDAKMQDTINTRAALEGKLRCALENRQFHLHYQIQVDSSNHPVGVEALIRWQHPERGLILPAQFIPLAEETGLILPIGLWVLETACAQLRAWQEHPFTRNLTLAVNVSARQFRQVDFVSQVRTTVLRHVIDPKRLKLELTESLLLENINDTIATMNALNKIGIQFSLDNFGAGYSSLQHLKRLPIEQLKIDQSFVRDIDSDNSDKSIVRTIIAMAHSLKLKVIAEGVETDEQRMRLIDKKCTHFQGYLFGKPAPIAETERPLRQGYFAIY